QALPPTDRYGSTLPRPHRDARAVEVLEERDEVAAGDGDDVAELRRREVGPATELCADDPGEAFEALPLHEQVRFHADHFVIALHELQQVHQLRGRPEAVPELIEPGRRGGRLGERPADLTAERLLVLPEAGPVVTAGDPAAAHG